MTRIILRSLNGPALILFTMLGIILQTSLFRSWPFLYLQPDVVLIVVIWCGLRRDFFEGGLITLIISNIAEVHSAAPQGLFLITYMMIYLLIRGADRIFVIPNLFSVVMLTLFGSVIWKLEGLGLLYGLGISTNQWKHTLTLLFPGAIIEGILGIWAYRWLERFDWITYKDKRAEKSMDEELQLNQEAL